MINVCYAPICHDSRPCFGKTEYRDQKRCTILSTAGYRDGKCPFCKSRKDDYEEEEHESGDAVANR